MLSYSRFIWNGVLLLIMILTMPLCKPGVWADPTVTNVTFAQREDTSGIVDIYYDVSGGVEPMWVSVIGSNDSGASWTVMPVAQYLSGDIRTGITNGTGKHIVWNGKEDLPGNCVREMQVRVIAADYEEPEEIILTLPGDVPLVLKRIPTGVFQMGRYSGEKDSYSKEDPQHTVNIGDGSAFYMGKYEVTQQQWLAVQGSWPGTAPNADLGLGDTYPAYYVSWDDVQTFITALNAHLAATSQPGTVRLPSESEWEYACRAGTQTRFYWGEDTDYSQIGTYAWYSDNNSPNGCKPVGEKLANTFGLYDMSGNVREWCQDYIHASYTDAPTDGSAWVLPTNSSRINRGGSWNLDASGNRSASRYSWYESNRDNNVVGFRLALVLPTKDVTITLPGDVPLVLKRIPTGVFQMGRYSGEVGSETDEDPRHTVNIGDGSAFYMGKYEVTQQQWLAVQGSWPGTAPNADSGLGDTYPAYYVSWDDVQTFITALNAHLAATSQPGTVRLPSESEWEYACRAGTQTRFYWGEDTDYSQIGTYAWYYDYPQYGTKPVGGKLANAFGLYDMSGNVFEWCQDYWHDTYTGAPTDGSAWVLPVASERVLRGGYFNSYQINCRSSSRYSRSPSWRFDNNFFGFRFVLVR